MAAIIPRVTLADSPRLRPPSWTRLCARPPRRRCFFLGSSRPRLSDLGAIRHRCASNRRDDILRVDEALRKSVVVNCILFAEEGRRNLVIAFLATRDRRLLRRACVREKPAGQRTVCLNAVYLTLPIVIRVRAIILRVKSLCTCPWIKPPPFGVLACSFYACMIYGARCIYSWQCPSITSHKFLFVPAYL